MWFARFSSLERSSPGGFWDLGIGATVAGLEEFVRERFRGVIIVAEGECGGGGGCCGFVLVMDREFYG
jgi:hypothetical protein